MTSSHAANFDMPTHHRHPENQPLPKPSETTTKYPFEGGIGDPVTRSERAYETTPRAPEGANAFTEERPLGVKPTEEGGVAIGGRPDLPMGNATMMDKVIGKTQKVVGKLTSDHNMHERGELRESGGKAAATGDARAPRD